MQKRPNRKEQKQGGREEKGIEIGRQGGERNINREVGRRKEQKQGGREEKGCPLSLIIRAGQGNNDALSPLSDIYLSIHLFVYLSIYLFVYLFIMYIYIHIYLSIMYVDEVSMGQHSMFQQSLSKECRKERWSIQLPTLKVYCVGVYCKQYSPSPTLLNFVCLLKNPKKAGFRRIRI